MFPINRVHVDKSLTEKGTYHKAKFVHGKYTAVMSCPKCSHNTTLQDYKIEPSGQVFPSFHCTGDDCNYNELVKLKDWN